MRPAITRIGKYELKAVLVRMPLSTVYDGWDSDIERRVAIKIIPLSTESDEETREALARFKRGARAAGHLNHPNIVSVHDYGETKDHAYIVMEFVDGPTLKTLTDSGKRMDLPEICRITGGILEALQYSHDHGVVHRDVKPANIMFTRDNQVKITDFGIARLENSQMTQPGMVIGTPAYMSPEQFIGEGVDWRTDIYSTAVVLYQLLTGERPFEGNLTTIMHKVLYSIPAPPSGLSPLATPALDDIISRGMAKKPADRFQSAAVFNAALQATVGRPVPVIPRIAAVAGRRPAGTRRPAPSSIPLYRRPVVVASVAVGVALAGAAAAALHLRAGSTSVSQPMVAEQRPIVAEQNGPAPAVPAERADLTPVATRVPIPNEPVPGAPVRSAPVPATLSATTAFSSREASVSTPDSGTEAEPGISPSSGATVVEPFSSGAHENAAPTGPKDGTAKNSLQHPTAGDSSPDRHTGEASARRSAQPARPRPPEETKTSRPVQEASNAAEPVAPGPRRKPDYDPVATTLPPWLVQKGHPVPPAETLPAPVYASTSVSAVGLLCQTVTTDTAAKFGLNSARGMVVSGVTVGSAADQAGIRVNDVILKVKGTEMHDLSPLPAIAAETAPGRAVPVEILRDGNRRTVQLKIDQLRR